MLPYRNYPAEEEETADGDLSANEKDTLVRLNHTFCLTLILRHIALKIIFYFFLFQRYLYYIQRGIDTEHVAPMEDSWLEHVMSLLHQKLRVCTDTCICSLTIFMYKQTSPRLASLLEKLCDEMRDDYLLGVKKSIGIMNDGSYSIQ